jgi:glycerophosphoryl diester phosphodiesterase
MTSTFPTLDVLDRAPQDPLCVAHRGASSTAPENTLAAVRAAVAAGVDHVEVDVRRTADRALVLHHDATLARTTDVCRRYPDRAPWRVADVTLAELSRLEAGGWFSPAYAGEPVPTLEDVVAALRGTGVGLVVVLKDPADQPGIVSELGSELRCLTARPDAPSVLVQSFDHGSMALFKTFEPAFDVALIGKVRRASLPALATWAAAVNPHHSSVDRGYVEAVHATGMRCMVWTANTPRAMRRAVDLGVDAITTDHPEQLRALLPLRT